MAIASIVCFLALELAKKLGLENTLAQRDVGVKKKPTIKKECVMDCSLWCACGHLWLLKGDHTQSCQFLVLSKEKTRSSRHCKSKPTAETQKAAWQSCLAESRLRRWWPADQLLVIDPFHKHCIYKQEHQAPFCTLKLLSENSSRSRTIWYNLGTQGRESVLFIEVCDGKVAEGPHQIARKSETLLVLILSCAFSLWIIKSFALLRERSSELLSCCCDKTPWARVVPEGRMVSLWAGAQRWELTHGKHKAEQTRSRTGECNPKACPSGLLSYFL